MSNIKSFVDYTFQDDGSAAREILYAEIHDRVMSHIETMKLELAGGLLAREGAGCDMEKKEDHEDEKEDKIMVKKMVKKDCLTKEGVEGDEDGWDEDEDEESDEFSEDE
jgi:hypothetical protein